LRCPPRNIDEIKIDLLRKRRDALTADNGYGDDEGEDDPDSFDELTEEEQGYLLDLLKGNEIQEEDAELVLTLMKDYSTDVMEFVPQLIRDFPSLVKRIYYFCSDIDDKDSLVESLNEHIQSEGLVTEYQLFWFAKMVEDYLLEAEGAGDLLRALYEHGQATDISRAKILENPSKAHGLPELREEQLRSGHSGWLAWSAAVGSRDLAKSQRNQLLKYFRKASPMNRLIGEFVETCF
jgi:hypothetical protein